MVPVRQRHAGLGKDHNFNYGEHSEGSVGSAGAPAVNDTLGTGRTVAQIALRNRGSSVSQASSAWFRGGQDHAGPAMPMCLRAEGVTGQRGALGRRDALAAHVADNQSPAGRTDGNTS